MDKRKIVIDLGRPGIIVFLAFFCAKIFGFIDWSWLWVLSPLWLPFAIILIPILIIGAGALFVGAIVLVLETVQYFRSRKRRR
jgi:hypothetical protein